MATVTLRPNGAGGHTGLTATPATNNYTRVDEAVVDDTDYVYRGTYTYEYDLYALEDHTIPAGSTVNSVTLYYRYKVGAGGGTACEKPAIYENSTLTYGTEACGNSTSWVDGSWAKTTKPSDSGAWSLTDINDLQVGIGLHGDSDYAVAYCSQIYVVVDYTEGGSEETAAYSALPITVTVPSTTASALEVDTATIAPLGVTATIPAMTASSVELRSAAYTASSVVMTVPSMTATSVSERAAAFAPISIVLEVPTTTATSVEERTAAYSALSVLAVVPSVTGTYLAELESTFDPVSMTVTIPSLTASREEVATAAIDPLSILATVPDQTATTETDAVASYTSLIISIVPPSMTAIYISELSAAYDPLSMKVTPIPTTAVVTRNRTGIKFGTKIEYYVEGLKVEDVG